MISQIKLQQCLLISLRIIQGLSVGGQFPSLISLSVKEHCYYKGFAVGLVFSISSLGFLLASIVAFLASSYFADHDTHLIWRIPFALSGVWFLYYLYLNRHENYNYPKQKLNNLNALTSMFKQYKAVFAVTCLTIMAASIYYIVFTYLVNYQITELGMTKQTAFFINSLILIIACIFYPIFGQLSDIIGAKHLFYIAAALFFLFAIPAMHLMHSKQPILIFLVMTTLTLLTGAIQGAISPLFAVIFEPEWQTTGCAFSYSIGNGISGAAPLVALTVVNINPIYGLGIFMILLLGIGSFGLMLGQRM